jgi:asparagine synthase (glutamine-hydrolysing)
MCGITGFVDYTKKSSRDLLISMTDSILHRGPDSSNYFFKVENTFSIGFGHRRLSIIDLTTFADQPMYFRDLTIVYNGEIYNYKELKKDLESLNHTFTTNSDTEVILHAFEEWGKDCVNKFIGMFAIVIYCKQTEKIYMFRDRVGVKPLFYYQNESSLIFGSELKTLMQNPNFEKKIKINSVASFMQYGCVPSPHTIFENTQKIKPGHIIEYDIHSKKINESCYWDVADFYSLPKLNISLEEAKEKTINLFKSAFNYRMVSDVPVGVFLSGGYDSSCVAALLSENFKNLNTFTIGFENRSRDEAPEAKKIANFLKTNHKELYCTEKELLDLIDNLPFYYDEPFGDSSAIPTILVSKLAKENVTVVLSADGGDELFAGYYKYNDFIKIKRKIDRIPKRITTSVSSVLNSISAKKIPFLNSKYNFENRYEKIRDILKEKSDESILNALNQQFTNNQVRGLFNQKFEIQSIILNSSKKYPKGLSFILAIDYQTYLNDDILQKVDRATMSVGLEGREPFLDHRIVEFVAQLPDNFKYRNGEKKFLLKEIVHDYIPKELMERPKKGFAIPLGDWLSNELKEKVDKYVNKSKIEEQNIFKWEEIEKIKSSFYKGKRENEMKLWYILMFQMWYERWMQ